VNDFYVISLKHSQKRHRYITFWRHDDKGYAWPLSWAGRYGREHVMGQIDYYNNGCDSISVPVDIIDAMTVAPNKGDIDGDAGPVVLNTAENWRKIMDAVIQPPQYQMKPQAIYFGRNAA
jgi:hypothetical protein